MQRIRARHLPVLADDGSLQGIVTDRDLRHHLFAPLIFGEIGQTSVQALLLKVPVKHVMTAPVVSVDPEAEVGEAAALMREHRIGSAPVVEAGRLVGILTETDLLRHIVREDEQVCPELPDIVVPFP
jgi:acetoin utilization protein AcuB